MKYSISKDRRTLTLKVDKAERKALRRIGEEIHQDATMHDFLEPLTCNSELDWVNPGDTGDLTDAPMLGIASIGERDAGYRKSELPADRHGEICVGGDAGGRYYAAITERWAWMNYQVLSLLEALAETGEANLTNGE